jgi:hypothetical protein
LPPKDFDPTYWNVAPNDQQLPDYQPGEEVRLFNMNERGTNFFFLPELEVPVMFSAAENTLQTYTQVDTIVIEPAERRFSLVARASFRPKPNLLGMGQVVVGPATRGCVRALESGKVYCVPRRWRTVA